MDALNIRGVLYHTWNYLDLNLSISPLPVILVDNYSFIDPSYLEDSLSNFYSDETYFEGKLAVHIKSKGYALGTSLKGIVNAVGEGTRSDSSASWPIDVGVYDISETDFSSPTISTYHMPVITISEGELDTYLGNEFEFKGYYINLEEAGGRIGSFIEELIDDDLKKMYENYTEEGLPLFFNEILDQLDDENSLVNGFSGFVFAYDFKEIHAEKTTLQYMFDNPEEFNGDDVSKHIKTEGYALGTTVGTIVKIVSSVASLGSASAAQYPIDLCFYNLHNFTMEDYVPRIYHVPVVYITTHTDPGTGVGPTYLETPVTVEGQFIDTGNLKQMFEEAVSEICSEEVMDVFFNNLTDGLMSVLGEYIKPLDGFIYATNIVESPISYHQPEFEIISNEAQDTIWLQTDKEDDFPIPGFDEFELDVIMPEIETLVKNVGDHLGIPTVKYIVTSPSGDQEDLYSAPNPIPGNSQNNIFPVSNISLLEEGEFNVVTYLYQGDTFKQYISENEVTFNVTKVSGHIETDHPHLDTHSMEERKVNITVKNTGNKTVEYTLVGINLPERLIGMELHGETAIIENYIEQKKVIIEPGKKKVVKFDVKTLFSGGYLEYFLFYDKSDDDLEDMFVHFEDIMSGFEFQELFDLTSARNYIFDLLYSCIPLSHVNVTIDFESSISLTDTSVFLDDSEKYSYYYADIYNSHSSVLTVQYSLTKYVENTFEGWDWEFPRLCVDIKKEGGGKWTVFDENSSWVEGIIPDTSKAIDFNDDNYGPGNYSFDIYLRVKNGAKEWMNITLSQHFAGPYIVDRVHGIIEPIDLNKLPRSFDGPKTINVTIKNNGTINWDFCIKVTTDWLLTSGDIPYGFLWNYNTSTIAPGENDTIPIEVKYVPLTGTGEFTISLLPSFVNQLYVLDTRYHEINVGPLFHELFTYIVPSPLDAKPILNDLYDDQKCHFYIPIADEDGINENTLKLYHKANGNNSYESVGLNASQWTPPGFPNNFSLYRTSQAIGTFLPGTVGIFINATDANRTYPMFTNVTRNLTIEDDDILPPTIGPFVLDPLIPTDGDQITVKCTIIDVLSGVYDDNTGSNGYGIYLLWTNDNWNTQQEIQMSTTGVPTQYQTDSPIPSQNTGAVIKYKVHAFDDDGDNNVSDRKGVFSLEQRIPLVGGIPDDDVVAPLCSLFVLDPLVPTDGDQITVKCTIIDILSGVYDDNTGSNGYGIYLLWTDDNWGTSHEIQMSVNGNKYQTDNPIPSQPTGTTIKYKVHAYDNDFDNNNVLDRSGAFSSVQIIPVIIDDDILSPLFPSFPVSTVVQNTNFYIRAEITDLSGIYDDNTGSNGQGIYIVWKKGLLGDWYEEKMSWDAGNNNYRTDNMINSGSFLGGYIYFHVYAYDNDCDNGLALDRSQGMSLVQTVIVTAL